MAEIELPFGDERLCVEISDDFLGEVVSPNQVEPPAEPRAVIEGALSEPIGSPPMEEVVRPGQKVAIVVDDNTRKTPAHLMLPPVLERLKRAGISSHDISLVMALGTHRPMTRAEIEAKVGPAVARAFEVVNTPSSDGSQFVYLGTSSSDIPAWVNRAVSAADVRIGIGSIIPHSDVGYGGGAKIVLPGVCNTTTVDTFHAREAMIEYNPMGKVETPLRHDMEKFVGEQVGLDFILNSILTLNGELYGCVAGHFVGAHRSGVPIARQVYGVRVRRRYPVVISNSFPADLDLWQSSKGLAAGEPMVSDGGILILVTRCQEGIGVHPRYPDYIGMELGALLQELEVGQPEDPNACGVATQVSRMKSRIRFGLVSPGLTERDADRMGFAYYPSVEEAIESELGRLPGDALIGVLTHAGLTVPLVQDQLGG